MKCLRKAMCLCCIMVLCMVSSTGNAVEPIIHIGNWSNNSSNVHQETNITITINNYGFGGMNNSNVEVKSSSDVIESFNLSALMPSKAEPDIPWSDVAITSYQISRGSILQFGSYPQQSSSKASSPIEWVVVDIGIDRVLLVSKYGIEAQAFQTGKVGTWATSSLRTFLNNDFIKKAFSVDERALILDTAIPATEKKTYEFDYSDGVTIKANKATTDKVFALSLDEVLRYFPTSKSRLVEITDYVRSKKAFTDKVNGHYAYWWLRDVNVEYNKLKRCCILHITGDGELGVTGQQNLANYVVRPAMWVDLSFLMKE